MPVDNKGKRKIDCGNRENRESQDKIANIASRYPA